MGLDSYWYLEEGDQRDEVGYFCKFNAMHGFIDDNVKGGVEDCEKVVVSLELAKELLRRCQRILEAKDAESEETFMETAEELLPCCEGFFFGSQKYDGGYISNVMELKEMLEEIIPELEDDDGISLIYYGWW